MFAWFPGGQEDMRRGMGSPAPLCRKIMRCPHAGCAFPEPQTIMLQSLLYMSVPYFTSTSCCSMTLPLKFGPYGAGSSLHCENK